MLALLPPQPTVFFAQDIRKVCHESHYCALPTHSSRTAFFLSQLSYKQKNQKPPSPKVNAPPVSHIPLRRMVTIMRPKEALSVVIKTEYCRWTYLFQNQASSVRQRCFSNAAGITPIIDPPLMPLASIRLGNKNTKLRVAHHQDRPKF